VRKGEVAFVLQLSSTKPLPTERCFFNFGVRVKMLGVRGLIHALVACKEFPTK
jgi:hypothetical protein